MTSRGSDTVRSSFSLGLGFRQDCRIHSQSLPGVRCLTFPSQIPPRPVPHGSGARFWDCIVIVPFVRRVEAFIVAIFTLAISGMRCIGRSTMYMMGRSEWAVRTGVGIRRHASWLLSDRCAWRGDLLLIRKCDDGGSGRIGK